MGPLTNVVEGNDPDIQEDPRSVQEGSVQTENTAPSQTHSPEAAPAVGRVSPRRRAVSQATPRSPRPDPASTSRSGAGGEPRGAQDASDAVNLSGLGSCCCL